MARRYSPDSMQRAVVWQPNTGTVWDAGGREVLGTWGINRSQKYFNAGDGSDKALSTSHTLMMDVVPEDLAEGIRLIAYQNCPVRAVVFGFVKHTLWLESTLLSRYPVRGKAGALATEQFRMKRKHVPGDGHIYDAQNLVFDFPWHCATMVQDATTGFYHFTRQNPDDQAGWRVEDATAAPSVDLLGLLNAGGGTEAILEFEFPVPNCTLKLEGIGATLEALGHPESSWGVLGTITNGGTITLNELVWSLRVKVADGSYLPSITVETVGSAVGFREGLCNVCSQPLEEQPPWSDITATIEASNLIVGDAEFTPDASNLLASTEGTTTIEASNLTGGTGTEFEADASNLTEAPGNIP